MDPLIIRSELKRMGKRDLLGLIGEEKKRWCGVGASKCRFFIHYKDFGFCVTELLGLGCSPESEFGEQTEDGSWKKVSHMPGS